MRSVFNVHGTGLDSTELPSVQCRVDKRLKKDEHAQALINHRYVCHCSVDFSRPPKPYCIQHDVSVSGLDDINRINSADVRSGHAEVRQS